MILYIIMYNPTGGVAAVGLFFGLLHLPRDRVENKAIHTFSLPRGKLCDFLTLAF